MTHPRQEPIELICLDLGGVLIRISSSWDDALLRAGVSGPPTVSWLHERTRVDGLNDRFERGQIDQQTYIDHLTAITGLDADDALAVLCAWLVEPYPGVDALLAQLETAGVRTACLSNTNLTHWQAMNRRGPHFLPLERFDYRFASPFIGKRKPDPAVYQHVQEQTAIAPQRILFFDDLADNVRSARDQNWHAHRVDPLDDPVAQVRRRLCQLGVL